MAPRKIVLKKRDKLLEKLYFDPSAPGSYSSAPKLTKAAKVKIEKDKRRWGRVKVDEDDVQKFLSGRETYTLHRPVRRRYPRRRVQVSQAWYQFQSDLVDMREFSKKNDGWSWILMTIDVFSRRGWAIPVKSKESQNMLVAMKRLLESEVERLPLKLQTDKGQEFLNKKVQSYLRSKGIVHFSSEDDVVKAGIVERLNRTIKNKMWKYFHHKHSNRWLEVLPKIMHSYNNTHHSSIKMTPIEASDPKRVVEVRTNLYGPENRLKKVDEMKQATKKDKFSKGDLVKLSKHAMAFDRGYKPGWSIERLRISEVLPTSPTVYRVKDEKGEEISGVFYEHELQRVTSHPELHDIEEVLDRKNGQVLVRWKGYTKDFDSWIDESSLVQYQS